MLLILLTLTGKGQVKLAFPSKTKLVNQCFEPSQPQRIISGLKETFIKRYRVERTNKAEIRSEDRVRKRRVVARIFGMKYS